MTLKKKRENLEPDLVLRVAILEAKKIPSRVKFDHSDPYFAVTFEQDTHKTQVSLALSGNASSHKNVD